MTLADKSFYVENLGCAKNQVDAELMVASLEHEGWVHTPDADSASVIIVNTCSFIQPAREESVSTFMDFRHTYPGKRIILAGCFSQRYGKDLESMIPEADGIFGNADPARIAEYANAIECGTAAKVFMPETAAETSLKRKPEFSPDGSAYVKIAEGCDNRCSFCAIPLIRGPLKSRTADSVVTEVKDLVDSGVFEINLVAQDLSSFGIDRGGEEFVDLIEKLCSLSGDFWLRMLYIHPDRFPRRIIDVCRDDQRLLPYFDLPFQHASARVLQKMGRRGNSHIYLDLIQEIRESLPASVIRSTFLVGHPGEGRADFEQLLGFQNDAQLDWAGFFTYSPEEGTVSNGMRNSLGDMLATPIAERRKQRLEREQIAISERRLDRFVGAELDILLEEPIQGESLTIGRSFFTAPDVDGSIVVHTENGEPGKVIRCKLIGRNGIDMEAVPHARR